MKKLVSAEIVSVQLLNQNYLLLTVDTGQAVKVFAGQFATLQIPDVFLRRPFSIHDAQGTRLTFLIKIVGGGTQKLANLSVGQKISVIYPLGKGFAVSKKQAVLVGGGCGSAPLLLLAKQLGGRPLVILGGRTKDDITQRDAFAQYAQVKITTEDGSLGTKGFVTAELPNLSPDCVVYACGPEPLLRSLHRLAQEKKFELQLSLEAVMACGLGACLGCVVKTRATGHLCVCQDGPVFRAEDLPW
ncbi:dihydroorotate dehydrogenase electron transfer subunit [Candidatus Termititenax persephonae]|uniref:Dihydroorotate dehydrogenase electron transfer subunit n=1 Tax=Candidatus Termititenax persephonae TaxID=2218525 RepID=A0A388TH67_9BACT|nr:dihydroorotate dehydrogenase electron transfer subunit [Candidatus Termititenax persephonae]